MLSIKIIRKDESSAGVVAGEDDIRLVYTQAYQDGDRIVVESGKQNIFLMIQLDDAMGQALVYLKDKLLSYQIPFGEKKICYSPKSFLGTKHLLTVRYATKEEISQYRNQAVNPYDRHGENGCYPHASANVETRGESVFAAKNAINGNCENHSHGEWPYESWGINKNPDACMKLEFGRTVTIDKLRLYTRADFPHDAWWKQATVEFSDQSTIVIALEKTDQAQEFVFEEKEVEWLVLKELIKADDPSPFPALTQFEAYGSNNTKKIKIESEGVDN